jgi:hypothetical protein
MHKNVVTQIRKSTGRRIPSYKIHGGHTGLRVPGFTTRKQLPGFVPEQSLIGSY